MRSLTIGAALCGLIACVSAIDPIEAKGNKFFHKDGSQYFIKGISYQLRPDDPLVDTEQCKRDVELMKVLGTNALRVYHVDAAANHDGCMAAFADAGIYLLIDLDTFDTYITPSNQCWSSRQFEKFSEVMDAFQKYNNVLAFFVGNENIARKEDSPGAPFLKAAVRDMKAYRDSKGYRKIPVGYSAADIKELRPMLQDYLTCGSNSSEIVDFFGLNSYSWCDPSNYEQSTYNQLQEYGKDFPVPIFFTETGCNVPGPRIWEDMDAIFGEEMVNDWSGAIIYEWIQEQNNYGVVNYGPPVGDPTKNDESVFDNWTRNGVPTPVNPDFENLKAKWSSIKPTGVRMEAYDPGHVSTRECPTSTEGGWWEVHGNVKLPALDETVTAFGGPVTVVTDSNGNNSRPPKASNTGSASSSHSQIPADAERSEAENEEKSSDSERLTVILGGSIMGVIFGLAIWL